MRQRKLLLPPFHGERMKAYGAIMHVITARSIERWPVGKAFSLHPFMQAITLDVILRAVFGLEEGARMRHLSALLVALFRPPPFVFAFLRSFQRGPLLRQIAILPYARFLRRRDRVREELISIIRERRRAGDEEARADVLSLLLLAKHEDGAPMTDPELCDELMTLLAAGHETTATSLSWAFERLLSTPETLQRLQDELAAARPDVAKIHELPYLDAVIHETLRLRPVIPIVVRQLQAPWRVAGRELPAGAYVAPCIYLMHRHPEVYRDPQRFDPARFLDLKPDPYAWLPLGGGIRRCIGMAFAQYEMAVVLGTVVPRARLRLASRLPVRTVRRAITLAPAGGTRVILESRLR
jgi:cytochrome P450